MAKTQIRTGDIGTSEITDADVAAANKDGTKSTYSMRTLSASTPAAIGTGAAGSSTAGSSSDHVHATGAGTPSTQAFGDAAATGSGPAAAMTDHKHAMPAAPIADHTHNATGNSSTGGGSTLTPTNVDIDGNLILSAGSPSVARLTGFSGGGVYLDTQSGAVDTEFLLEATSGQRGYFSAHVEGDSSRRFRAEGNATVTGIELGPGNAARDIALVRLAAKTLRIFDPSGPSDLTELDVDAVTTSLSGDLWVAGADLQIGADARVRRSAAKTLMLDDAAGATLTALDLKTALLRWGGTSFPASPATNDLFYRTDLQMEFFYNGTRWLSTTLFTMQSIESGVSGISVTTSFENKAVPGLAGGSDLWLETMTSQFFVNGGTALSGSHKWVITNNKAIAANTNTTFDTGNINSGSSSVWRTLTATIGALLNNGTTHYTIRGTATKTGTPGTLTLVQSLTYRIVAT